jgi:hypothetical protein
MIRSLLVSFAVWLLGRLAPDRLARRRPVIALDGFPWETTGTNAACSACGRSIHYRELSHWTDVDGTGVVRGRCICRSCWCDTHFRNRAA